MSRLGSEGEDIIGHWSEDKLKLLAKYLQAYSKIMHKQKQTWLKAYYYVDAFAGSLRPIAKDEQRYIDGSPLRALRTEPSFDAYWFIDTSAKRVANLEKLRENFPDRTIEIRQGDCNRILREEIIPHIPYTSSRRALIFLDPYGLEVDWETVSELANVKTCDLFINFSVMGVTRLLPRKREPTPEAIAQLNRVMGSTDWLEQIYQPSDQLSLFPDEEVQLSRKTIEAESLASLYAERLRSLSRYVSRAVLMKNSTNSAIYALCLASHNEKAVEITNDIFKRYQRLK